MKGRTLIQVFFFVALLPLVHCSKCGQDEDDATSAVPPPPPPPSASETVLVAVEDAGADADAADADDADADAPKGTGDPTGIRKCCAALRQNATNAPLQQQGAYMLAAGACDVMASKGALQLAELRRMLLGASMPASCK